MIDPDHRERMEDAARSLRARRRVQATQLPLVEAAKAPEDPEAPGTDLAGRLRRRAGEALLSVNDVDLARLLLEAAQYIETGGPA